MTTKGLWSIADGQRLVFTNADGFYTVNADGTNQQLLMQGGTEGIQSIVWLAQDEIVITRVARSAGGGTIFTVGLITGGQLSMLTSFARPELYIRPDKRQVAYIAGPPVPHKLGELRLYPPRSTLSED